MRCKACDVLLETYELSRKTSSQVNTLIYAVPVLSIQTMRYTGLKNLKNLTTFSTFSLNRGVHL